MLKCVTSCPWKSGRALCSRTSKGDGSGFRPWKLFIFIFLSTALIILCQRMLNRLLTDGEKRVNRKRTCSCPWSCWRAFCSWSCWRACRGESFCSCFLARRSLKVISWELAKDDLINIPTKLKLHAKLWAPNLFVGIIMLLLSIVFPYVYQLDCQIIFLIGGGALLNLF